MKTKSLKKTIIKSIIVFFTLAWGAVACGLKKDAYVSYPRPQAKKGENTDACPVASQAFEFFVIPLLQKRCLNGCHGPGGNGSGALPLGRGVDADRQTLKSFAGGDPEEIYQKSSGTKPHVGGGAAIPGDRRRFKQWAGVEKICTLEDLKSEERAQKILQRSSDSSVSLD
jgi:hypothetical protein